MTFDVSIGSSLIAGFFSFFSPCIIPLLPVYLSILTESSAPASGEPQTKSELYRVLNGVLFVLGVGVSFVVLGFGFGTISVLLSKRYVAIGAGVLIILMGLSQMGLFQIPFFSRFSDRSSEVKVKNGSARAFLIGLLVSIGWLPCIGPILSSILFLSGSSGSAWRGGGLMVVYILGFAVPFMMITIFSDFFLKRLRKIHPHLPLIKKIGGALLVIMGIYQILR